MKRVVILLVAVLLTGCSFIQPPPEVTVSVACVSPEGELLRPVVDGITGNWGPVPAMERVVLSWEWRTDEYGNPLGLSPGWTLELVRIKCELKTQFDTIFWPKPIGIPGVGPMEGFAKCVWYPTWTGPIEPTVQLPYSPFPETGYPFSTCSFMASQTATIYARASRDSLIAEILVSGIEGGWWEFGGGIPIDGNPVRVEVEAPGVYELVHSTGQVFEVEIPASWFVIEGEWEIQVGPAGCSG